MFSIPLEYYSEFFFHVLLCIVLIVLVHTISSQGNEYTTIVFNKVLLVATLLWVVLYMGLRPISYIFGDMGTYAKHFDYVAKGGMLPEKDIGFSVFFNICARFISAEFFFFLCAFLYVVPPYLTFYKWHKNYAFLAFLIFIASMSFWAYGVNGMRSGIASSLFIFALSYRKRVFYMVLFLLLSISFHKSMALPVLAFAITFVINNPKVYIIGWIVSIFLSISLGGFWETFFASIGFGDERIGGYLTSNEYASHFSRTGFRWDFLLYGALPIFGGILFIYKYKFRDKLYYQILNTYLLCNAFWVLVIRASFSNRFAYLSWFFMAIVIMYPLLKKKMFSYQYSKIGIIIFSYYLFTLTLYYITTSR